MIATKNPATPAALVQSAPPAASYFTPLEHETRPTVSTAAAAFYLHKASQTLRIWACKESGPIRPVRVGNALHWSTADIRRLLGVSQ